MAEEKRQFNVYLSPELIREIKYAALDADISLSGFVEEALRNHLVMLKAIKKASEEAAKQLRVETKEGGKK